MHNVEFILIKKKQIRQTRNTESIGCRRNLCFRKKKKKPKQKRIAPRVNRWTASPWPRFVQNGSRDRHRPRRVIGGSRLELLGIELYGWIQFFLENNEKIIISMAIDSWLPIGSDHWLISNFLQLCFCAGWWNTRHSLTSSGRKKPDDSPVPSGWGRRSQWPAGIEFFERIS